MWCCVLGIQLVQALRALSALRDEGVLTEALYEEAARAELAAWTRRNEQAPIYRRAALKADDRGPWKKILPAGALLWAWEADADFEEAAGEQWLMLLPDKWNRQVHYGWRYDPREREAARAERERQEALERAAECPGRQKAPKQKK